MSMIGNTRNASSGLEDADMVDQCPVIGRRPDTTQAEPSAVRVGLRGREESAGIHERYERVHIDRSFAQPAALNGIARHANSSGDGIPEKCVWPQPLQQSSISQTQRMRVMDNTATLMSRSAYLQELAVALERHTNGMRGSNQFETAVEGFSIVLSRHSVQPIRHASEPAICMTVQGAEWAMVGKKRYDYRAGQAFILSVEEPCRRTVPVASPIHPYLGLVVELDRAYTAQLIEELGIRLKPARKDRACGSFVLDLSPQLLNCALRAVRLLDTPEAIPMLYPGIMHEICYWLLTGPACDQIVDTTMANVHDRRVLQAIQHLRGNFSDQIRVEELASAAGMSPATFHRKFKSVTSMSPLQYQKQLRLLEARRLMITSDFNVENVACEVGYVSASQFSREYTRLFGKPPRRDMSTCRSSQSTAQHVA
jgi:AraC-like DNA-binding protein